MGVYYLDDEVRFLGEEIELLLVGVPRGKKGIILDKSDNKLLGGFGVNAHEVLDGLDLQEAVDRGIGLEEQREGSLLDLLGVLLEENVRGNILNKSDHLQLGGVEVVVLEELIEKLAGLTLAELSLRE